MSTKTTFKQKSVNIKVGNKINITQLIVENITLSLLPTSTYIFFGLSNFYLSDLDDIKTDKKYSQAILVFVLVQFYQNFIPAFVKKKLSLFFSKQNGNNQSWVRYRIYLRKSVTNKWFWLLRFTVFERNHLDAHNEYRANHLCPPLKLSSALCRYAQERASRLAKKGVILHRSNLQYGENTYMLPPTNPLVKMTGRMPVDAWYDEIKYFVFGKTGFSSKTRNFTQLVWKSTTDVGVGKATNRWTFSFSRNFDQHSGTVYFPYLYRSGQTFVVTNYNRPGNYACQFDTNVPRNLPISNTQTVDPSVEEVRITKIESLQPDAQLIAGEE
jgi:glioma pathogenesis-related protein 2